MKKAPTNKNNPKPEPFKHLAFVIKLLSCFEEPIEKIAEKEDN